MKNQEKKFGTPISSIFMYIAAVLVGLSAIALLVSNVRLYSSAVAQYVAQGYKAAEVKKQLIPGQLLPGIFQPVALYGGIAFILFSAGIINKKVSNLLIVSVSDETIDSAIENETIKEVESITEVTTQADAAEQTSEVTPTDEN